MNLSKLEAYPSKEALAEELRRLTIESEVKHHGCCQVIVQTFLDILGVQNEALSMAASPFVGGLALTGNNCGAVIGGLMVLGAVFGRKELQEGMPGLLKGIKPMRKLVKVFVGQARNRQLPRSDRGHVGRLDAGAGVFCRRGFGTLCRYDGRCSRLGR